MQQQQQQQQHGKRPKIFTEGNLSTKEQTNTKVI
jgi:hypothetical protein